VQPAVRLDPDTTKPVMCQAVPEGPMRELVQKYRDLVIQHGQKLPNIVGILTVADNQTTQNEQQNLKRIDIKMIWYVPELDPNRNLVYVTGPNGEQTPKLQMVERVVDDKGTKQLAPAIQTSGKTVFVNRLSEYHGE